jgi:large subunit ribosomal protein L29
MKGPNYRDMTDDELRKELADLRRLRMNLRFKRVTDVVENPAEFRKVRRAIARIQTILRERERTPARTPPAS